MQSRSRALSRSTAPMAGHPSSRGAPQRSSRLSSPRPSVRAQVAAARASSGVPSPLSPMLRSTNPPKSLSSSPPALCARIARFLSAPSSSDLPPRMYSRALSLCREQVRKRREGGERKSEQPEREGKKETAGACKLQACALPAPSRLSGSPRFFFLFFPPPLSFALAIAAVARRPPPQKKMTTGLRASLRGLRARRLPAARELKGLGELGPGREASDE